MDDIKKHFAFVHELLSSSSLSGALSRNAFGSLAVRVAALILAFLLNVILARSLGANEYGLYVYAVGWLNILLIPATFGFDRLLVRQISIYQSQNEWSHLRGVFRFAIRRVTLVSMILGLFLAGIVYLTTNTDRRFVFYGVALLMPILATARVQQSALQGLNFIGLSQLPELVIQPLTLTLGVFIFFLLSDSLLSAFQIMILNIAAGMISLYFGVLLMRNLFRLNVPEVTPTLHRPDWIPSLLPFMLVSGIYILNDQLAAVLLGALSNSRDVAVYSAAERWARFVVFMLYSLNPVLSPVFASLYAQKEWVKLQRVVSLSAQIITLFAILPSMALIMAPRLFLSAFGDDFVAGQIPLIILCLGQLINALAGSVGVLLTMVGSERTVMFGAGLGVLVNLLLGYLLIPNLHAAGAAIGTTVSAILTNSILAIYTFRRLRIYPTALGLLFARDRMPVP